MTVDKEGHVVIDDECRTNVKTIDAIGDVAGIPYLGRRSGEGARAQRISRGLRARVDC